MKVYEDKFMNQLVKIRNSLRGILKAIYRFPLSAFFLITATIINTANINMIEVSYNKYLITAIVGAVLGAVFQVIYERFFYHIKYQITLTAAELLLTAGYYYLIYSEPELGIELRVRTVVILFTLLISFIWIPVFKSKITFNESFMVVFKAIFISIFFSGIIFAGCSIILSAINQLLLPVDSKAYAHTANIVFILFAPIYFLSLIPIYPGEKDKIKKLNVQVGSLKSLVISSYLDKPEEAVVKNTNKQYKNIKTASSCPKFLEILISYILIPLTAVFTIILLLYIILNVGGQFWTNNLLEPMIVIYSIIVIVIYILSSLLNNKFAVYYRKFIPKVLIPIVLFQIIATLIKTNDYGITLTRYFVILYGIFAITAGVIFSILPVRRNGLAAVFLIILSLISIIPPMDAFTVSLSSQIQLLEGTLRENNMLEADTVRPDPDISDKSKQQIIQSVNYLNMVQKTNKISWMPKKFNYYDDFYKTFGFYPSGQSVGKNLFVNLSLPQNIPIDISGYDAFLYTNVELTDYNEANEVIGSIEKSGKQYSLVKRISEAENKILLLNENRQELLQFPFDDLFSRYKESSSKGLLTKDEATFLIENEAAAMKIIVQNVNMNWDGSQKYYMADLYIMVKLK
jgi:hypothetical protein